MSWVANQETTCVNFCNVTIAHRVSVPLKQQRSTISHQSITVAEALPLLLPMHCPLLSVTFSVYAPPFCGGAFSQHRAEKRLDHGFRNGFFQELAPLFVDSSPSEQGVHGISEEFHTEHARQKVNCLPVTSDIHTPKLGSRSY